MIVTLASCDRAKPDASDDAPRVAQRAQAPPAARHEAAFTKVRAALDCAGQPQPAWQPWCDALAGFDAAPHAPWPAEASGLWMGAMLDAPLTQPLTLTHTAQLDPVALGWQRPDPAQPPRVLLEALKAPIAIDTRKGIAFQTARALAGGPARVVIHEAPLRERLSALGQRASVAPSEHTAGWFLPEQEGWDIRQVGQRWVAVKASPGGVEGAPPTVSIALLTPLALVAPDAPDGPAAPVAPEDPLAPQAP